VDDIVQHNGSAWLSILSGTNQTPPTLPTVSNTYWNLLASSATVATGVAFTPAGNIAATNVQSAIAELDSEKQAALGFTPVNKAGDTMTGLLTLSGAPTNSLHAATKAYVDAADATKQASLGYTPVNKAGDTLTGNLYFGSGQLNTNGAVYSIFNSSVTTGAVYLGNTGTKYLWWDGAQYQLPGANLLLNGQYVPLTASNGITKTGVNLALDNVIAAVSNMSIGSLTWNARGQITSYVANCNCNCSNC
jgi:hypothetical protein